MATRLALADLDMFNRQPCALNASKLVNIPALYVILKVEGKGSGSYSEPILEICKWIHKRGVEVLKQLLGNDLPLADMVQSNGNDNWEIVSVSIVGRHA